MKIVKVVAAVICDLLKEKIEYLLQLEAMVNLKDSGSFQAEK